MVFLPLTVFLGLALGFTKEQVPLSQDQKLKVFGRNPFFYCNDPSQYTLQIACINFTPTDPADWRPYVHACIHVPGP